MADITNRLWIIGVPRSGTKYSATVLQAAGLDVKHEKVGAHGTVDWKQLARRIPDDAAVLHQVRHPLDCMTSLQTIRPGSFARLAKSTSVGGPEFTAANRVEACARFWLLYNVQCQALADATFRVESDEEWSAALQVAGLPPIGREPIPRDVNTRRRIPDARPWYRRPITWTQIEQCAGTRILRSVQELARCYGYDVN